MQHPTILSVDKIPGLLMNFSWAAKMEACARYSRASMWHGRMWRSEAMNTAPFPWELCQFAALATIYADGQLPIIPDDIFAQIINCFRNRVPRYAIQTIDDIKNFLSYETGMVQIPYQMDALILFFRYRYLFTFVDDDNGLDMPKIFNSTFGVSCDEVAMLSALSFIASSQDKYWLQFIREFCHAHHVRPSTRFAEIVNLFSINRTEYANKESALIEFSTDGAANAFNLMEVRPFVRVRDSYYLPLPYLLNVATTRHLFDRMMDAKPDLRARVGRAAMEAYVFKLFNEAECYDEVCREFEYRRGKDKVLSPDIILKQSGEIVFVEVKLLEAPVELRQMANCDVEKTKKVAAKHVYQVYSRTMEIAQGLARPVLEIDLEKTFCLIAVHEDSYTVRDEIYERCFLAHPELNESDRQFIRSRITIVSLYEVEKFCYRHRSILPALRKRLNDKPGNESMLLETQNFDGADLDLPFDEYLIPLLEEAPKALFHPVNED